MKNRINIAILLGIISLAILVVLGRQLNHKESVPVDTQPTFTVKDATKAYKDFQNGGDISKGCKDINGRVFDCKG